jgi:hypothetical protein
VTPQQQQQQIIIIIIIVIIIIQFFIYIRADLNSECLITESARIQTTAIRQHRTKQTKKKTKKDESAKAF